MRARHEGTTALRQSLGVVVRFDWVQQNLITDLEVFCTVVQWMQVWHGFVYKAKITHCIVGYTPRDCFPNVQSAS